MSTLTLKELSAPTGEVIKIAAGKTLDLKSQGNVTMPTGSVLQVVSSTKSDTFSVTGMTFTDVPDLSVTLTPTSTSSKILVSVDMHLDSSIRYAAAKLYRDSTLIAIGDASGNRARVFIACQRNQDATNDQYVLHNQSGSYLDSPTTTSAVTYKIKVANTYDSNGVTYVNRTHPDDNYSYAHRGVSTITLQEIKG